MPSRYASGKNSIAECDRCAQRYKLHELRTQTLKTKPWRIKVCKTCWDSDHPQLRIGMYPVNDPQAVREPRPDVSYLLSGQSGLQTDGQGDTSQAGFGYPPGGSRVIQWGWAPVGGARSNDATLTPNDLICFGQVGTVTVTVG